MQGINEIIENWDNLTIDDKEYTIEILQKDLIQSRREQIILRTKEAESNYNKGLIKSGTVENLFEDLEND
jgi:hypothetical protein